MLLVRVLRFLALLCATSCLFATSGRAQAIQPEITSDKFELDLATNESVFNGQARLTYGNVLLTADEIRFNRKTNVVAARGNFVLTYGKRRMLADNGETTLIRPLVYVEERDIIAFSPLICVRQRQSAFVHVIRGVRVFHIRIGMLTR